MSTVKVAIAGVGNCANSLIQGVTHYRDADPGARVPGLMHVDLGGYHVGDVEFVAAFDVDAAKVGQDLSKAMWCGMNDTFRFAEVPELGVEVLRGPTFDGLGKYYRLTIEESAAEPVDVVKALRDSGADVLVSYLPVGSEDATRFTPSAPWRRVLRSSTPSRCSSPATRCGRAASTRRGFPSSATTSSHRSGRPSSTGSWRGSSRIAASWWSA